MAGNTFDLTEAEGATLGTASGLAAELSTHTNTAPIDAHHILIERYLTLVEATLAGTIYEDDPLRASGVEKYDPTLREYGWDWPSKALTMIGLKRLRNFRAVIESVIGTDVAGDIMEAGVWRGGSGIMARAVLAAYGITDRRVILADSFAGLPPPNPSAYPADAGSTFHEHPDLAIPLEEVRRNFAKFGLLDEQVVFLPGWFADTLPTAPIRRLAVLRLDCDMYESSIQVLENLYDRVATNGWIVVDDYEVIPACRAAVHDFLGARRLMPEIYPIDGVGVFFRKIEVCNDAADEAAVAAYRAQQRAVPKLATPFLPVNVDFVAWREALMAVVRAGDAIANANENATKARQEAETVNDHMAILRGHLGIAQDQLRDAHAELSTVQQQLAAAQADATHSRHSLETVLGSRSWKLSRPYRAVGTVLRRIRGAGGPAPNRVPERSIEPSDRPRAEADLLSRWPIWTNDHTFRTRHFVYTTTLDRYDDVTRRDRIVLLKGRAFLDFYQKLAQTLRPRRILEIGFFQGGMPLLLADMVMPEKVVGIDYLQPSEELTAVISGAGLQDTVKLYGGVLQNDSPALRRIVQSEFPSAPLDLIIDDASHEYENTKNCFEELFSYLRPGGKYVIEDWGWLHWPGDEWQTARSHFWDKPAMTNLIFELVMTLGTQHPKIIAKFEIVSWACAIVTRGEGLAHGERIDLSATRLTSGRTFQPI